MCWLIFNMTKSSKSSFSLVRPLYIIPKQQTIRKSICLPEHELLLLLSCATCVHRLNIFNLIIKYILYRSYLIGHYLLLITDVNVIITPLSPGITLTSTAYTDACSDDRIRIVQFQCLMNVITTKRKHGYKVISKDREETHVSIL